VVIPGKQSEGEKDKVIQLTDITTKAQPTPPENNHKDTPPVTETVPPPNLIPFPSKKPDDSPEVTVDNPVNKELTLGRGL
jgi:hypothetical protein